MQKIECEHDKACVYMVNPAGHVVSVREHAVLDEQGNLKPGFKYASESDLAAAKARGEVPKDE